MDTNTKTKQMENEHIRMWKRWTSLEMQVLSNVTLHLNHRFVKVPRCLIRLCTHTLFQNHSKTPKQNKLYKNQNKSYQEPKQNRSRRNIKSKHNNRETQQTTRLNRSNQQQRRIDKLTQIAIVGTLSESVHNRDETLGPYLEIANLDRETFFF